MSAATRWCDNDHDGVWFDEGACFMCGDPGVPARAEHASARSWRNPAEWRADREEAS